MMDSFDKKRFAMEVLNNRYLLAKIEEQKDIYRNKLENGDPSLPEALVAANLSLRAIVALEKSIKRDANQKLEEN